MFWINSNNFHIWSINFWTICKNLLKFYLIARREIQFEKFKWIGNKFTIGGIFHFSLYVSIMIVLMWCLLIIQFIKVKPQYTHAETMEVNMKFCMRNKIEDWSFVDRTMSECLPQSFLVYFAYFVCSLRNNWRL